MNRGFFSFNAIVIVRVRVKGVVSIPLVESPTKILFPGFHRHINGAGCGSGYRRIVCVSRNAHFFNRVYRRNKEIWPLLLRVSVPPSST